MVTKEWCQEGKVAGHMESGVMKQREMNADKHIIFFFTFYLC